MIGTYTVTVRNSKNSYEFELRRNITILTGDSGKGKTTLYEMIYEYNRYDKQSGVKLSCDKPVLAIDGNNWENKIENTQDSIIVIDEDGEFIRTHEFARIVRNSSNYFLLITRNYLPQLPYSVEEIYEIKGRGKKKTFAHKYVSIDYMYNKPNAERLPFEPDLVITEDSGTGFQFFEHITSRERIKCTSAEGKSNISKKLHESGNDRKLVIADGAAFGSEIDNLVKRQQYDPNKLAIFLPESFEWLILKSGLVMNQEDPRIQSPEAYVECQDYNSWEQYFTSLLESVTKEREYLKYEKRALKSFYLQESSIRAITKNMQHIKFKRNDTLLNLNYS